MVYMTHACVTLLSSGGMHNYPTPSSQTAFRLFRLSQPPDPLRVPYPLRPIHKIDLLIPPRQRSVNGASGEHHGKSVAISAAAAGTNNLGGEVGEGGDMTITGPQAGLTGN
jgi:hypothetical protein